MCETPRKLHQAPSGPGGRVWKDVEPNVEFEPPRVVLVPLVLLVLLVVLALVLAPVLALVLAL